MDKFWRIHLYYDKGHVQEANFRVLVTTNAVNVGIDKSHIALQVRFDWPRGLLTYFQERGRGLRQPGVRSTCVLYADLSSYVFLLCQLVRGSEHSVVIMTINPVNVRALIQPFLHNGQRRGMQT